MNKAIEQLKEVNPKLNDFLVERRLRTKFLKNYLNRCQHIIKGIGDRTPDYLIMLRSIGGAFIWNVTPEGFLFWRTLNNEFEDLKK